MDDVRKTVFELSLDTKAIYDLLATAAVGQTISFAAMSDSLGRTVMGGEPHVQSALHRIQSMDGRVFANVRGVGYRRLNDAEIVGTGTREIDTIRRRAKRAGRRLTCVADFAALPNDLKVKHNTFLSMFGAIASMMKPKAVKRVETEVTRAQAALPLAKTLEAFKSTT